MRYRLVAVDLDDTFLDSAGNISKRNLAAVKKALAKKVCIVLASGRMYRSIRPFYKLMDLNTPVIAYGGAQVLDSRGQVLSQSIVPHALAREVLLYAKSQGVYAQVYLGDDFVFEKSCEHSENYAAVNGFPGVENPGLLASDDLSTPKILLIGQPEKIAAIQPEAARLFPRLQAALSRPYFLEFNHPEATKGNALKFVADYLKVPREAVIAMGDSGIDLSMIEYAGLGVAVQNALPHVKDRADFVTLSNDEDGGAYVLEKYVLEEYSEKSFECAPVCPGFEA